MCPHFDYFNPRFLQSSKDSRIRISGQKFLTLERIKRRAIYIIKQNGTIYILKLFTEF